MSLAKRVSVDGDSFHWSACSDQSPGWQAVDREQHLSLPEALKLGTLEQIALYAVQHLYDLF